MPFFGKNKAVAQTQHSPSAAPASVAKTNQGADPNLIRVYDEYGRELFITKEQWRTNVLPGSLKSNWDNPNQLYSVIIGSLNDGFFADVLDAAKHLYEIDSIPVRGVCAYGIVLMKNGRLKEAESLFLTHIQAHGEDGVVLTNLAKVYSARNEHQKSEDTLWRALKLDPNQDNGLLWYATQCRERSGESAWLEGFARVAALPGSWRAQLWLARAALEAHELEKALSYYQQSLDRIGESVPADLLMQISGDLGKNGFLKESIQLTEPRFVPGIHGLAVGNNLIKAHLDLGEIDAARGVLDRLYALRRPEFKQNLSFWDTEIAKAKIALANVPDEPAPQVTIAAIDGPVWLKPSSPGTELFSEKSRNSQVIAFLGFTAEMPSHADRAQWQIADGPGRMSRMLPLFLAEQVWFNTTARATVLVPTVTAIQRAFVLGGVAWRDEDAIRYSSLGSLKSDLVVVTHLKCGREQWTADLRLIRSNDHELVLQYSASFHPAKPEEAIPELAKQLLSQIVELEPLARQDCPSLYHVPAGTNLPYYLLRLEQLMAARFAAMDGEQSSFLHGEREIIDGNLQLCLDCPENVGTRIVLAKTLLSMKLVRPKLIGEFKDKIELLQRKKSLPEPAQSIVSRMINEALTI